MARAQALIVFARMPDNLTLSEASLPTLPTPLRARLLAMRSAAARNRSLVGYWLLAQGTELIDVTQVDLSALVTDTHGRPYIPGVPDFNISHSGDLVACAIARHCRVGMDVERIRNVNTTKLRRFLGEDRPESDSSPSDFFADWAAREATVKASGKIGLARIARVQLSGGLARVDDETWRLHFPKLASDYAACLATDVSDVKLQVQDLSESLTKYNAA